MFVVHAAKREREAVFGSQRVQHGTVTSHVLLCLPVVVLSDGPGAEGRHKPHLRDATDQEQAARHLLQRLPNPVQLRGTGHVRCPFGIFRDLFFPLSLKRGRGLHPIPFNFRDKGSCCWGLSSELRPLWNLAQRSRTQNLYNLLLFFFVLRAFVEFLCIRSAHSTVELSNVPFGPLAAPPATLSVLLEKHQRCS